MPSVRSLGCKPSDGPKGADAVGSANIAVMLAAGLCAILIAADAVSDGMVPAAVPLEVRGAAIVSGDREFAIGVGEDVGAQRVGAAGSAEQRNGSIAAGGRDAWACVSGSVGGEHI